jgi:hypothetical protein
MNRLAPYLSSEGFGGASQNILQAEAVGVLRPSLVSLPSPAVKWKRWVPKPRKVRVGDTGGTLYHVQGGVRITASQLANLVAATVLLGLSLGGLCGSLLFSQLAALVPWFFWLIPFLGSLGVALGICLNLYSAAD